MKAVALALGRELSQAEARDIEERITRAARHIAQADPAAWVRKSAGEKLNESGQRAAQELLGEAKLKAFRESLKIAANARFEQYKGDAAVRGLDALDALDRKTAFHSDQKAGTTSIESNANAVAQDLLRQLIPVMEASNPKWFGLLENREGIEAIIKEIHGEDSGNPVAKAGAKIWHEVAEAARQRFNAAGGDVGKLDDWGMPHHHSQARVARAGQDEYRASQGRLDRLKDVIHDNPPPPDYSRDKWISDVLPLLKREKYVNDDGSRMTDAELGDFLREAWASIATGGANKMEPGKFRGNGMRANRGNATRQIHFKDADSYIKYLQKYGEKALFDVLIGHIESVAKDIGLTEEFGPNTDQAVRMHREQAVHDLTVADPARAGAIRKRAIRSENLYNYVSGKTQPVASERLARNFDTVRNFLTGGRLGGAAISSITDEGTLYLTAHLNNLPAMRVLANEVAAFNPANKKEERMAMRAGLALNTFIASLNRFGQQAYGKSFSRKMANTVLRVSGLNAMTEARRRAFGVTMMGALGSVAREHDTMGRLDPKDAEILKSKGVSEENFRMWKAAELEDWGGGNDTMLTPDSIYRIPDAAVDQVIGGKVAKLKREAQEHVDALKARDVEDRGWVASRAAKLSDWLTKKSADLTAAARAANADARVEISQAKARISKLNENIDALAESWRNPPDGNTPGVSNEQAVGFYGKAALRAKGLDEGAAREQMRQIRAEIAGIKRELGSSKAAEVSELRQAFDERKAELDEFTSESQKRIDRRTKVIDRINRDLDPAIARMRTDARAQAATKLLASVLEETNMAVVEPGARERAFMRAGIQRGTWKGELAGSFYLFKSFPLAMIMRHWGRGLAQGTPGQRATYIATLIATTTVLGAMNMQIKELLAGRDPRNLNPAKDYGLRNWLKAMLQGGSLGMYGDFLFSEDNQHGGGALASAAGPVAGLAEDAFKLTQGNIVQAAQGKDTNAGAEAVRFVQGNLPGANLWYSKAILDHLLWQQLMEYYSPGYLPQMQRRAQREFGTKYWWEPGEAVPQRAPDLANAVGAGK